MTPTYLARFATITTGYQLKAKIIIQLVFLTGAMFFFCYCILVADLFISSLLSLFLVFFFTFNIFSLTTATERNFTQFLRNIIHNDFNSTSINDSLLAEAQQVILQKFKQLQQDRGLKHEYLKLVVEHVDTGLICFDQSGHIDIINNAAKDLLHVNSLLSITQIRSIDFELAKAIENNKAGQTTLVKSVINHDLRQLLLTTTEFSLLDNRYHLVSLKNVKQTLDENEIKSWQKLIRILSHEIMNSMTPIVSLSKYLECFVSDQKKLSNASNKNSSEFNDLKRSLNAIHSRSSNLVKFFNAYKGLNSLSPKKIKPVELNNLLIRLQSLYMSEFKRSNIHFTLLTLPVNESNLTLWLDLHSIEQVLINLLSNAMDAIDLKKTPTITLLCQLSSPSKLQIIVKDNGCGINETLLADIFTPFLTTKPEGSGIGLSLSKQLVQLNNGSLTATSSEHSGSTFTLTLTFHVQIEENLYR